MGSEARRIEIEKDTEAEHVESTDYYFNRIGKPIPIIKDDTNDSPVAVFQLKNPPSQPLAISLPHRLIFVAHSCGFYVARTKDVMDAAKDIKDKATSSSIRQLCLLDVPLPNLHILSVSSDFSTLAVSAAQFIHFFSIDSLINKDVKPAFSDSLPEPSTVKDFKWTKASQTSYLVLSDNRKLYHAALHSPLKRVLDDVDAVDWSVKGKLIAVARDNFLTILSSKFKERLRISLPFESWVGDSDDKSIVKVDSISWVRNDSIIVGCFQQTADGKEENYLLQAIKSTDGKITDATCKPVVLSFYDLFSGLIDDIVPHGTGPYLFLSYLEQCGLALAANRKNTDQHVVLLGWSMDNDSSDIAAIDIERDSWLPRIELQDNGEDNLIMGLCVDNVSLYEKVKVEVGVEEQKELSPYCVLICVTLEGKLVMFHVASVTESSSPSLIDSALDDDEEDILEEVPEVCDESSCSSGSGQQTLQEPFLGFQLQDVSKKEDYDLSLIEKNENLITEVKKQPVFQEEVVKNHELKSHVDSKSIMVEEQHKVLPNDLNTDIIGQKQQLYRQESGTLGHLNFKMANSEGPTTVGDSSKSEAKKFGISGSGPPLLGEVPTNAPSQLYHRDFLRSIEPAKETAVKTASAPTWGQRASIGSLGSGSAFHTEDTATKSSPVNFSVGSAPTGEQRAPIVAGTIESLPSIRSPQLLSQENFAFGKPSNLKPFLSKDKHEAPSVSRQLGNIKEMVKELDMLLDCIEGAGGFRDACTGFQRTSVESLEEGMKALSGKTRMWKSVLDEQIGVIQNLLDKTVQVLARKIYIDGIIKQASDNQYWELWNRQKLSSELELKRNHILELNQDLTNRLIELERHFNTLELNDFGENGGSHAAQRALQGRYRPSRHTQSLHSLHSAVTSQLAAADKLSECLSKQMSVLSVESPVKQKNVKKELFETIGIPYDASFSSPDTTKAGDNSLLKKLRLSAGSDATEDHSRRRQSSASKNLDSETARRRRDSLDQSLASFEPTRTTVKRVLLQESQRSSVNKSLPLMNRQHHFEARVLDRSAVTHEGEQTLPSTFSYLSRNKVSATKESPTTSQNTVREAYNMTAEKSRNKVSDLEKFDSSFNNGMKPLEQSETSLNKTSSTSMVLTKQMQFTPNKLVEMPNLSTKEKWLMSSAIESVKDEKTNTNDFISKSVSEKLNSSFSLAASMASNIHGKTCQFDVADGKGRAGETVSSSPAFSMPVGTSPSPTMSSPLNLKNSFLTSSATASSLSTTMPFGASLTSSKAITDANAVISSTSLSSVSSFPVFPPSSVSLQTSSTLVGSLNQPSVSEYFKTEVQPVMTKIPPSMVAIAPPLKPEVQPSAKSAVSLSAPVSSQTGLQTHTSGVPSSLTSIPPKVKTEPPKIDVPLAADKVDKTNVDTPPLAKSPEFSLNLESSASSVTTGTGLASASQCSLSNVKSPISIALNGQPQLASSGGVQFGSTVPTSDIGNSIKNESLDILGAEEDEMEEEAPETSQANELSLASLGGFGFGSTPSSTVPRGNPFGGPFGNAGTTQVSSSLNMTIPSGELFRPASFSLQSPQPPQPSPQTQMGAFSGGFGTGTVAQPPTQTGFGQPSQIGQQALGSVLGGFGQSRQIGTGLPGIASASGFGAGFASTSAMGGFSSAATAGGFASLARSGAGFASVASGGGGFGAMASGGGGFAAAASGGGGFAGAASGGGFSAGGGGFGGFGSQQGAGGFAAFSSNTGSAQQATAGFSSFSSNTGGAGKPSELFSQMRK